MMPRETDARPDHLDGKPVWPGALGRCASRLPASWERWMTIDDRSLAGGFLGVLVVGLLLAGCAERTNPFAGLSGRGSIAGRVEVSDRADGAPAERASDSGRLGTARVLVYVEPTRARVWSRADSVPHEVEIRDGRQQPEVQLLAPGRDLVVHNLDSIYHDLFTSDPKRRVEARLRGGETSARIPIRNPGFFRAFCRLHPEESFAFVVRDHLRAVAVAPDSTFELPDLPPGEYRVRAASADGEGPPTVVRVDRAQTTRLTLRLPYGRPA